MRFYDYLEEKSIDIIDTGKKGKRFEHKLIKALEMVGLKFEANHYAGKMWDIKPTGKGWQKLIIDQPVNIKIATAKWMFGNSELYKMLPWDKLPEDFDADKAAMKVKRFLNKQGISDIVYLKPKDKMIQQQISDAVDNEDIKKLNTLLVKNNFYMEKLGKNYNVRILKNDERVTSIAIDNKDGKVFMRTEKPRNMGAGAGTTMVTFRTPKNYKFGKGIEKNIKVNEANMKLHANFLKELSDIIETSKNDTVMKIDVVALSDDYIKKGLSLKDQVKMLEIVNKLKGMLKK